MKDYGQLYAIINKHNEVEAIHLEHKLADQAVIDAKQDVRPIMTVDYWFNMSKDFRGTVKGTPYVLYLNTGHGTCLKPVYLIESWDEWQIRTSDDDRLHKRYRDFIVQAAGKIQTQEFRKVLRFMQEMDPNGDWLGETEDFSATILQTISRWSTEQSLVITPDVQTHIDYLNWVIAGRMKPWEPISEEDAANERDWGYGQ